MAIQQKLADANPSVTEFQLDLALSHMSIGIVLSETGDPVGARRRYDKAIAIQQKLADANPNVTSSRHDLANGHSNLGLLLSKTGDTAAARRPTARQSRSVRSWPMPTLASFSSGRNWRKA